MLYSRRPTRNHVSSPPNNKSCILSAQQKQSSIPFAQQINHVSTPPNKNKYCILFDQQKQTLYRLRPTKKYCIPSAQHKHPVSPPSNQKKQKSKTKTKQTSKQNKEINAFFCQGNSAFER